MESQAVKWPLKLKGKGCTTKNCSPRNDYSHNDVNLSTPSLPFLVTTFDFTTA